MFKAKLKDSKIVRGIFEAVSSIITQVNLKVTSQGLSMTAMDLSHICLVSLNLKKEDLDEFETDKDYSLGINLVDLVKIIKRSGSNDEISFIHNPADKKLVIEMKPESSKKSRKFTMALMELDDEEINLEGLEAMEFDNKTTLNVDFLDEAIKDAEIYAETLEVRVEDKLIFSCSGNIGDMEYVLEKDELDSADFTENSKGIFALSFLKNVLKIATVSKQIRMQLRTEAPLKMDFEILNNSRILYFLAPRVEEDDEMDEDY